MDIQNFLVCCKKHATIRKSLYIHARMNVGIFLFHSNRRPTPRRIDMWHAPKKRTISKGKACFSVPPSINSRGSIAVSFPVGSKFDDTSEPFSTSLARLLDFLPKFQSLWPCHVAVGLRQPWPIVVWIKGKIQVERLKEWKNNSSWHRNGVGNRRLMSFFFQQKREGKKRKCVDAGLA